MIRNCLSLCLITLALSCYTFNCNAQEEEKGDIRMVQKGDVVQVDYKLTVNDEIIDSSEGRGPLEVTVGQGQLIPGFEKELIGMKEGEKKSFQVAPEDGYGPLNEEAFAKVPREKLGDDITPEVGMILSVGSPDGRTHRVKIHEVDNDTITLDFNHPLAGQTLNFDIELVGIKEGASESDNESDNE